MHWSYWLASFMVIGLIVGLMVYTYRVPSALLDDALNNQGTVGEFANTPPLADPEDVCKEEDVGIGDVEFQRKSLPQIIEKDFSKTPIPRLVPPESTRVGKKDPHRTFMDAVMNDFEADGR